MKGYYKNWYQHYLEVENQKEKDLQRGYYSNLAEKKETAPQKEKVKHVYPEKKAAMIHRPIPVPSGRHKKNNFGAISFLLPITTVLGFVFLWYQLDVGLIRSLTHDALVWVGIREDTINVVSYHTNLLDQHTEFAEKVATYITGEGETDFETLQLLYDEIRGAHIEVTQVSDDQYKEAVRLWSFKLYSVSEMMKELAGGDDLSEVHEAFVHDQEEIASMIRSALGLDP